MFACHPVRMGIAIAISGLLALMPLTSTAQQVSAFSIAGWVPGAAPIFSGSSSNVIALGYGDSLHTNIAFTGVPEDGLGTDHDNMAYMNFSYSYTIYLTPSGTAFSTASVPVGSHTVSASQTCSSGMVAPWSIGCDAQPTVSSDSLVMNVADGISDCIAPGDYQIDIVFDNYAIGTGGPNPTPITLEWQGADTTLILPEASNMPATALTPVESYILGQVAYVHIAQPTDCPSLSLAMQQRATSAALSSATVSATYPGACIKNPCTYQWSDGQTGPTAEGLTVGVYTVTVTAPCGTTATASVIVSHHALLPTFNNQEAISENSLRVPYISGADENAQTNNTISNDEEKDKRSSGAEKSRKSLNAYPNPALHTVYFDLKAEVSGPYSISIMDLGGNEVKRTAYDGVSKQISINVDDLPAGTYIYEIAADHAYSGKFVKQ